MRKMGHARLVLSVVAALLLATALGPQTADAQRPQEDGAELRERLDSLARAVSTKPWAAGISVAVLRSSDTLLLRGYGHADVGLAVPATAETKYRLVGPTGTVLAVLLMQQVERGRIALDTDVSRWLPDFPWQGRTVTLRQLLDTSSGLPDFHYLGDPFLSEIAVPKAQDEVTALFAGLPFTHEPGERQQWTISGFHLAGVLLERITAKTFGDLVEEEIVRPLGLEHAAYCGGREIISDLATGYGIGGESLLRARPVHPSMYPFEVTICASAPDVASFYRALRHGSLIQPETYAQMTALDATGREEFERTAEARAIGGFVGELEGYRMYSEWGGLGIGFNSAAYDFPQEDLTVVVLRNSPGGGSSQHLAENLSRAVLGLPLLEAENETSPTLEDLALAPEAPWRYEGFYRTRRGVEGSLDPGQYERTYRIYDENGRLMIQPLGEPPMRLMKQGENRFSTAALPWVNWVFTVTDGRASEIAMYVGERMIEQGSRVEGAEGRNPR